MGDREPARCDVCGIVIGHAGNGRVIGLSVSDVAEAHAHGNFCSLEHAAQWLAAGPELQPFKHPMRPGELYPVLMGCGLILVSVLLVICIVVGAVVIARTVV